MNLGRSAWKDLFTSIMKMILREKGMNSLSHYNLVQKFIPMPQAVKIPDARAAVVKGWEKIRENTSMAAGESQKQN